VENDPQKSATETLLPPGVTKTPMFSACNAERYRRQELIKQIEQKTGKTLLCYVGGVGTLVHRDDALFLGDLLHNVQRDTPIDLMLHTGGGDIDAAEKLMSMLNAAAGTANLRVIVPDYAKSAGTLMALGADAIVMSDSSELGPIDPQIETVDGEGRVSVVAVQNYLDAYKELCDIVNKDTDDQAARIMLDKFEYPRILKYRAAVERATKLAENLLKSRMFKDETYLPTEPVAELRDTNRYQSHGQMIGIEEAKRIKLNVETLPPSDETWRLIWQLYCYQRLAVRDEQKLFESRIASLTH
jgi:ATP-dependent protease ClpP protease subunit